MKCLTQANLHMPDAGIYGDCHRTCTAMILGIERDDVPNFAVNYGKPEEWEKAVDEFLRPKGLSEFTIPFKADDAKAVMELVCKLNPGQPYILAGTSRSGTNHYVVIAPSGEMYDPSRNSSGIVGPCNDGYFWITVYSRWCRD